jgi:hypothetical protein
MVKVEGGSLYPATDKWRCPFESIDKSFDAKNGLGYYIILKKIPKTTIVVNPYN